MKPKTVNDPYAALRNTHFLYFLSLRFFMVFAWSMQFIIIEWEVYSLAKDPLSLGLIGLMEVIPAIGMALFAGHIVDQNEKKGILVKCILAFSVLTGALFCLTWEPLAQHLSAHAILYGFYGLVFLGGIIRAFIGPSLFSFLGLIIPKKLYSNAATWSSSVWQMAFFTGSAVAGLFINWIGVSGSMIFILCCSLLALLSLSKIPKQPVLNAKIGEPIFESLREGLLFVFQNKTILGALSLDMVAVLFGGAVSLLPIFAQDILKVGPTGFGILRAAPAVGAFVTMLIAAYIPLTRNAGLKLLAAIFAFGLCIVGFGLSTVFWLSVVLLCLSGAFDGISVVLRHTILQLHTPDSMRGRVSAVNSIFVGSSNELGAFESGFTARLMGTVPAVVFGGCMTLLIVGGTAAFSPSFRTLDLEKEVDEN
jgi:MFS family permease